MNKSKIKTIFFDYDGTIHNSLAIYKPAFLKAVKLLETLNYKESREYTDEEISSFLGQSPKEMWSTFGEGIPSEVTNKASALIGQTMAEQIKAGNASLYDGALEVLSYLKDKGYTLVFLSNCTNKYMKNHQTMFSLDQYFDKMVNAQMYDYRPKEEILQSIKQEYKDDMVMIGDRHHDMKAGIENGLYTIACLYGYGRDGELDGADIFIQDIKELMEIF